MSGDVKKTDQGQIEALQAAIADLMAREVILSREILSNLREEESALLSHDKSALQTTMSRRDAPLQELMAIREDRIESVRELAVLLFQAKHKRGEAPSEYRDKSSGELLDLTTIDSCEVLVLRDQLIALIEKMNSQNSSNRQLFEHHREYAHALNEHLDQWGYKITEKKPPFVERRKTPSLAVINRD